ncbi:10751_t:CDS:2 [Funneliformis geosporum]|uniref:10751_t:CDS:1 n=1 Tax=Funneliformis geosporum TaxID=1117311 RepID=A0A9W4WUA2_9GLOM|nr:10751_t:CDS:2 [Funneliformis geosporum]
MNQNINASNIITDEEKDYLTFRNTNSNENCKETLKKFGILTIAIELIKVFIRNEGRGSQTPTGELHIDGARTALFSYLWAKSNQGQFILRVEDTDLERNREELAITVLTDKRKELAQEKEEYIKTKQKRNYQYSRKCLNLSENEIQSFFKEKKPYVIRLKIPQVQNYSFCDLVRGEIKFQGKDIEDFVLFRQSGIPNYNFACVVDDYLMKISHVLRGEEHLSNTGKQLVLYEAFG